MPDMITVPSHCIVTIRRENGEIEKMDYTKATNGQVVTMSQTVLAVVNKAMAAARRGKIISYENMTKDVEGVKPSAADVAQERYIMKHNAIMRAGAGGEKCDQIT